MKLLFSNEWLRQNIASDPDHEPGAGSWLDDDGVLDQGPQAVKVAAMADRNVVQLRVALGVLVRQLRLKERLTISELAERAQVSEDELRQVEHDPHYTARPRLIYQLSIYFKVSLMNLSQMSGTTHAVERKLYNAAVRYAAWSDDMSSLTVQELEALNAFVEMLNEQSKV